MKFNGKTSPEKVLNAQNPPKTSETPRFRPLFWRFLLILTVAAIVPLASVGIGAYYVFNGIIYSKSVEKFQSLAENHAALVEVFLAERMKALTLASSSVDLEQLAAKNELRVLLDRLNGIYSYTFQDLGVIDRDGNHLAYVGKYDLLDKNYHDEAWFKQVTEKGSYISDVFLGFRNTPHFILAVKRPTPDGFHILRASIDSDVFSKLVANGAQGQSGDSFLIDRNGRYQTYPRHEAGLLEVSGIDPGAFFSGVRTQSAVSENDSPLLRATKWVERPRWLLVIQQEEAEFMASVRQATIQGMAVFLLGVFVILAAAFFTTRYLLGLAESAMRDKEELSRQFVQASKLAAIGELATGLAHEINNPLAIILSEQTNFLDLLGEVEIDEEHHRDLTDSVSLVKRQVLRCRSITQKMLKFGRQGDTRAEHIQPGRHLDEIVRLLEKQAAVNNIELRLVLDGTLPEILIDSGEFEQVITNLVTNAMQAVNREGTVRVGAFLDHEQVHFTVEDTGPGIAPSHLDSIFTPFFTTKPAGKGTGLGLSVCYGIITRWNGRIWAESEPGRGAVFHFTVPIADKASPHSTPEGA